MSCADILHELVELRLIHQRVFVVLEGLAVRVEFEGGNDLIFAEAGERVKGNLRMLPAEVSIGVFAKVGKHRAVVHVMTVNHKVVADPGHTGLVDVRNTVVAI